MILSNTGVFYVIYPNYSFRVISQNTETEKIISTDKRGTHKKAHVYEVVNWS